MSYFYRFLEPVSRELAQTTKELEGAIYNSPRAMLTHSRTFIEAILEKIMINENMPNEPYLTIIERINDLDEQALLNVDVKNALHEVRKLGNQAAHDGRQFRFSESLKAWEHIYIIVKWFVEVYGYYKIEVPPYVDPKMKAESFYDLEEMNIRFKKIEILLKQSINREEASSNQYEERTELKKEDKEYKPGSQAATESILNDTIDKAPGLTPVRTIIYSEDSIDIPYFLRDAFLLPQRFEKSEEFVLRLVEKQEARIMSELPSSLVDFHKRITRRNESHSKTFFDELKYFIKEEIRRKKLIESRPGELFVFYESDEIVVTEELSKVEINKVNFDGMPNLINQMNEDEIKTVGDLPKELVVIGKYNRVGKTTVGNFFEQLKAIQKITIKASKGRIYNGNEEK